MEEPIREIHETTTQVGNTTEKTQDVWEPQLAKARGPRIVSRIIWYLAGILLALLGVRFILVLLGANPSNSFANFIYSASHPFVAPFVTLFGYTIRYGVARIEPFTLVAMVVYFLVALGIAKLVTITQD